MSPENTDKPAAAAHASRAEGMRRTSRMVLSALAVGVALCALYGLFSVAMLILHGPEATVYFPTRGSSTDEESAFLGAGVGLAVAAVGIVGMLVMRRNFNRSIAKAEERAER